MSSLSLTQVAGSSVRAVVSAGGSWEFSSGGVYESGSAGPNGRDGSILGVIRDSVEISIGARGGMIDCEARGAGGGCEELGSTGGGGWAGDR